MRNGFSPAEVSSLQNAPVLAEHADEAAFLWRARERAALGPHYRFGQLAQLDERVLAHLQGLHVAGATGQQLALHALGDLDAGTLFVATHLAFGRQDPDAMAHTLSIASSDPAWAQPFVAALSWLDPAALEPLLDRIALSPVAAHRAIALAARVAQRAVVRQQLVAALDDPHAGLRAHALRAVGELGLVEFHARIETSAADPDAACRFWTAWSRALGGDEVAAERAFEAGIEAHVPGPALEVSMRAGRAGWARELIRRLASDSGTQRQAIVAAGAHGDPATVPWLLQLCDEDALARAAAQALAMITGVDLEDPLLRRDAPTSEEEHADDADAWWASADALRRWWRVESGRFRAGVRHLGGRPVSEEAAVQLLRDGTQQQRRSAALEAARLRRGTAVFPVTARADWQHRRLAA
jgi:uncharacterized protein (TIGR02270 family)